MSRIHLTRQGATGRIRSWAERRCGCAPQNREHVRLAKNVTNYTPDDFAFPASSLHEPELSRFWQRATYKYCIDGSSIALAHVAFAALEHWSTMPFTGIGTPQTSGIQGAVDTAARCIVDIENQSWELTRQLGAFFHSANIEVAFTAIREFEWRIPRPHSMFVIDHLVQVASASEVPVSPIAMSLRGIAFKVLFDLDPSFRTFPTLATACEECIIGCRAWALDGGQVYRDTLKKLLRYRAQTG